MAVAHEDFPVYPVRVSGRLDPELSRWLWLVKWFLVIPHYFVLAFLWIAFALLTVVAFFGILFTGRYPEGIFAFNVGVLRWSWRVGYYSYSALATDRYPPFTLADVPDYPAHLEIQYPEHLSRGLVLVKWWLLAIPHYIIVGILAGGLAIGWQSWHVAGGVIGLLTVVAAIVLLITTKYPEQLFDVILGLDRWVLRVAAYAGLMTDKYPPFRVDTGPDEPGGALAIGNEPHDPAPDPATPGTPGARAVAAPIPAPGSPSAHWSAGRIVAVVFGAILVLPSLGVLAGGGVLLGFDLAGRDASGYINTSTETFSTGTYAISSDRISLPGGVDWVSHALGTVRVRITPVAPARTSFVGIGPTAEVQRYLANVSHAVTTDFTSQRNTRTITGTAPPASPAAQTFWVASSSGAGTQSVTWHAESGDWSIVTMNADSSPGMTVRVKIGTTAPSLRWIGIGLLCGGFFLSVLSAGLLIGGIRRPRR